jgi:hypothetical protein
MAVCVVMLNVIRVIVIMLNVLRLIVIMLNILRLSVIMLNVAMLIVTMLNNVMISAIMLNEGWPCAVMPNVVVMIVAAPSESMPVLMKCFHAEITYQSQHYGRNLTRHERGAVTSDRRH